MTEAEFQKVKTLLLACAANIKHCRKVITRSSALVNRAKNRIEFSQANLRSKNAWATKQPIEMSGRYAADRVFFVGDFTKTGKSDDPEPTVLIP